MRPPGGGHRASPRAARRRTRDLRRRRAQVREARRLLARSPAISEEILMRLSSASLFLSHLFAPATFAAPRAYVLSEPTTGAGNLDVVDASGAPAQHHFVTRFGVSSRNWYLVADGAHQRVYTTGEANSFIETMD